MFRRLVMVCSLGVVTALAGCGGDESETATSSGSGAGAGGSGGAGATTSVTTGGGNGGAGSTSASTTDAATTSATTSTGSGMCADPTMCGACNGVVSFAADVEPILAQSCATTSCHKGVSAKEGLRLEVGNAYAELVDVASKQCAGKSLVVPGDPAASYLMDKLLNQNLCEGKKMPPSASLSATKIQTIADWICGGALND